MNSPRFHSRHGRLADLRYSHESDTKSNKILFCFASTDFVGFSSNSTKSLSAVAVPMNCNIRVEIKSFMFTYFEVKAYFFHATKDF